MLVSLRAAWICCVTRTRGIPLRTAFSSVLPFASADGSVCRRTPLHAVHCLCCGSLVRVQHLVAALICAFCISPTAFSSVFIACHFRRVRAACAARTAAARYLLLLARTCLSLLNAATGRCVADLPPFAAAAHVGSDLLARVRRGSFCGYGTRRRRAAFAAWLSSVQSPRAPLPAYHACTRIFRLPHCAWHTCCRLGRTTRTEQWFRVLPADAPRSTLPRAVCTAPAGAALYWRRCAACNAFLLRALYARCGSG